MRESTQEHIQDVERTRMSKVKAWCQLSQSDVAAKITCIEQAMHAGVPHAEDLFAVVGRLREDKEQMDMDLIQVRHSVQQLANRSSQLEARLAKVHDDAWTVANEEEQDVPMQLWKAAFELQALTRRQSHARTKQLCVLEDRWKLFYVHRMLRRQQDVHAAESSGDVTEIASLRSRLEQLSADSQTRAAAAKARITAELERAAASQRELRSAAQPRSANLEATRDTLVALGFTVMVEDLHLAWIRKEQLQAVELGAQLRGAMLIRNRANWKSLTVLPRSVVDDFNQGTPWEGGEGGEEDAPMRPMVLTQQPQKRRVQVLSPNSSGNVLI